MRVVTRRRTSDEDTAFGCWTLRLAVGHSVWLLEQCGMMRTLRLAVGHCVWLLEQCGMMRTLSLAVGEVR